MERISFLKSNLKHFGPAYRQFDESFYRTDKTRVDAPSAAVDGDTVDGQKKQSDIHAA